MDADSIMRYNDVFIIVGRLLMRYFLCLGSNSGDRKQNLFTALSRIKQGGIKILSCSSLYETEPVEMPGKTWFINLVVEVNTEMMPHDLLAWIKRTEADMGRELTRKLESRVIDIDILLAEDTTIHTDKLQIPHPKLAKRNFVLEPLSEIAPNTIHPILRKRIHKLLLDSKDSHHVKIIEESG